jgi:hypothetical protein
MNFHFLENRATMFSFFFRNAIDLKQTQITDFDFWKYGITKKVF